MVVASVLAIASLSVALVVSFLLMSVTSYGTSVDGPGTSELNEREGEAVHTRGGFRRVRAYGCIG
jgi:hypothetical protein